MQYLSKSSGCVFDDVACRYADLVSACNFSSVRWSCTYVGLFDKEGPCAYGSIRYCTPTRQQNDSRHANLLRTRKVVVSFQKLRPLTIGRWKTVSGAYRRSAIAKSGESGAARDAAGCESELVHQIAWPGSTGYFYRVRE